MYCLMEFCKMSFPIHFDFSLLSGIIMRPLFTSFCSCFLLSFQKKITFFMLGTWYCIRCFLSFFLGKMFSRIHCNFVFITLLNCLPQFHLPRCFITFLNVFNILHVLQYKMFVEFTQEKMFFRIHCNFVFQHFSQV